MNKKGFTLVELLAAVAIIALLLILIVPNVVSLFNRSIEETMKIEEGQAVDAASVYIRDNCGRTAIDSYNKQKCNTRVTDEKLENNEVYFCLKEVQGQKYIGDILLKGKTPCDGVIIYKYDSDDGKFSEGKAYLTCGENLYTTQGADIYKEQFKACEATLPETPSEPTPEPNPPVPVVPAESIFKVSIDNAGGTSAGYSQIYLKYGIGWYFDNAASNQITSLNTPVKTGYTFNGYYTGTNGTLEKVVDETGNIISGKERVFTSDGTLYASWISEIYRIALNDNGATTSGTKEIYEKYNVAWYSEREAKTEIRVIQKPSKPGYIFTGYNSESGVKVIDETGNILDGKTNTFTSEGVLNALYTPRIYPVSLSQMNATTHGTETIFLKYGIGWYEDSEASKEINSIKAPKREGYLFDGYYTGQNGQGNKVIDKDGKIIPGTTTAISQEAPAGVLFPNYIICPAGTYNDGTKDECQICPNSENVQTWTSDRISCTISTCVKGYILVENKCIEKPEPASWTIPGEYTYKIPYNGYFKIELWGAQGGNGNTNGKAIAGGKGGYTSGEIYLTKGTVLNVFIGGKGDDGIAKKSAGGAGGYNGGAKGGNDSSGDDDPAGGGGGASDIRIGGTEYSNRIIVAGGGGGGSPSHVGAGGNMFSGSSNSSGNLGVGQNGRNSTWPSGGGGGGYYGGASLQNDGGLGYGGTSYVSNDFTNISIMVGDNPNDGKGKVSFIGERPSTFDSNTFTKPGYYSFTSSQKGYYKLELWGAKGGTGYREGKEMSGGNGGYTSGEIYLDSGSTIYAYVGEVGRDGYVYAHEGGYGGYNGGAKGGNDTGDDNDPAGGGGGASDIRIGGNEFSNRILVAGGGGGGSASFIGNVGNLNQGSANSSGNLGVGQNGHNSSWPTSGGGGGYYGGASMQNDYGVGFGGTSYVSSDFTNVSVIPGNNTSNNGKAKITFVGETPTKNSSNNTYTTAGYYSFTAPQKGYYKLEVWGAKGGTGYREGKEMSGAKGGYTSGEIYLDKGSTIYAYVGGRGNNAEISTIGGSYGGFGGYNGGAKGGNDTGGDNDPAGGGGGASDIRISGTEHSNRILVAGGGGGGCPNYTGGIGNLNQGTLNSSGKIGIGQDGRDSSWPSAGGGGGYYGGASNQIDGGFGFGGTSYVSKDFINIFVIPGKNSDNNGKVQITYVGEAPTKNPLNNTYATVGYYSYKTSQTGYYKLEVWGAQGGTGSGSGTSQIGGAGGYTSGYIHLNSNTTLYVYVGGQGNVGNPSISMGGYGGYNGGAKGGNDTSDDDDVGGGGGGASDIRIGGNEFSDRIIVAGGGGGGGPSLAGSLGNSSSSTSNSSGKVGIGQDGRNSTWPSGGGGGGYYGGASMQTDGGIAYGGTYYISSDFISTSVTAGSNTGAGKVQITWYGTTAP